MRKNWIVTCVLLGLVAILAGCSGKSAQQTMEASSDSLLAANPTEPAPGDITPQTPYEQPKEPEPAAPVVSAPKPKAQAPKPRTESPRPAPSNPGVTVPEGTPIKVTLDAQISSETAQPGDTWTGVVKEPVVIGTAAPIPAGSIVHGVITGSLAAERGNRATLVLAVKSITVGSTVHAVPAGTDSIIAGSPRARNLGAIAGTAAAGALIGKAVGGGKGALIGGLVGAGAATGVVAKSKGYQVVLKPGTEMTFTTNHSVVMKS